MSNVKNRGRKLVHRNRSWQWHFANPLLIWDDQDKLHKVSLGNVDRDIEKRNFSLRPKQVVEIIDRHILGYDDRRGFPPGVLPDDFRMARKEGFDLLSGPRGKWQIRVERLHCVLISPEGVEYTPSLSDILRKEWVDSYMELISAGVRKLREERQHVSVIELWDEVRDATPVPSLDFKAIREYLRTTFSA